MRRRGSHVRIPIDAMPLASCALLAVADEVRVWEGGFEPGSQIRLSVSEPRGADTTHADSQVLLKAVGDNCAVLVGGELRKGSKHVHESVAVAGGAFDYRVDANGFWRVHRMAPVMLADHVMDLVRRALDGRKQAVLWDLYSGSGLFTLPLGMLAAERTRMLSIEGGRTAVRNARYDLRHCRIISMDARVGDVRRTLQQVPRGLAHPDVVVLDPQRAGARADVCRRIAAAAPRGIIYVACDPTSLARDTATLTAAGYRLADIRAYDIYPMTHHVETVALMSRKDK